MTRSRCIKIISLAAVLLVSLQSASLCFVNAQKIDQSLLNKQQTVDKESSQVEVAENIKNTIPSYGEYLKTVPSTVADGSSVVIPGTDYIQKESTSVEGITNLDGEKAVLTTRNGEVVWEFEVSKQGLYSLTIQYYPVKGYGGTIERHLKVDGASPYKQLQYLALCRVWGDQTGLEEFERDPQDIDIRPTQVETPCWVTTDLYDATGYYVEPLTVYLTKGPHRLALESVKEPMAIAWISVNAPKDTPTYAQYAAGNTAAQTAQKQYIDIQAEHALTKSDMSIYAVNDRTSPITEPQSPSKIRLNSIGGSKWQTVGQTLSWLFTVEETGYYQITLRCKQNINSGNFSSRKIRIDNKLLFEEMQQVRFQYQDSWRLITLGNQEGPYSFYLTEGEHVISMEVVLGDMADILNRAEECLTRLNAVYRQILMITGASPDLYRDYGFSEKIPKTVQEIAECTKLLKAISKDMMKIVKKKGQGTALLDQFVYQLEQMAKKPEEKIASSFTAFKSNISSLGNWIVSAKNQPLQIDYIAIHTEDYPLKKMDSGFFAKAWFEIQSFVATFFNDYDVVGEISDTKDTLLVWVATGRDQASVLKQMVEDSFKPKTDINVNVQLVAAASLLPSTLAGVGPDVSLDSTSVIDYGLRGAVLDISQMKNVDDIKQRFHQSAWVPYTFNGAIYGVPQTQSFSLMFYRTDIFEQLDIKVPTTWTEFYALLPIIKINNMEIGFPVGGTAGTLIFMYQNGESLYRDNGALVNLGSDIALAAFQKTCELFTKYKLPVSYDFVNRFKTGEMPIGIADYTVYNQLQVFAPEIKGLWSLEIIPGTVNENEKINHASTASGTAAVIMSSCKNPKDAWEFIKWWTDADAQSRYAREVEGILGPSAKYPTANIEAFKRISTWSSAESEKIQLQWEWCVGTPDVPGGYYTSRCMEFAYNKVYSNRDNPVESLLSYQDEINQELARKRKEFNLK